MAEVKWIKITTDMFDNRKIRHLRRLPEGNSIVLIWVMLLTMAGRCNAGGMIFLTENIPYTPKMLADELDFEESTVQLALNALEQLDMVATRNGCFAIAGWEEHQNVEGMDKIRESKRLAQARWRAKQKALSAVDSTVDSTRYPVDDAEEDKDIDTDKESREKKTDLQSVVDLFHSICVSYPRVRTLSEARKKAIGARLKQYTMEDFKTLFQNAEGSSFLKGANDRNWNATFDWLIADRNMAKVLEGNYADRGRRHGRKEALPDWMGRRDLDADELDAIQRMMQDDTEFQAEAEQLRRELQESFGRE